MSNPEEPLYEKPENPNASIEKTQTLETAGDNLGNLLEAGIKALKDPDAQAVYSMMTVFKIARLNEDSFAAAANTETFFQPLNKTYDEVSTALAKSEDEANFVAVSLSTFKTISVLGNISEQNIVGGNRQDCIEQKARLFGRVAKTLSETSPDGVSMLAFTQGIKNDSLGKASAVEMFPYMETDTKNIVAIATARRKDEKSIENTAKMLPYLDKDGTDLLQSLTHEN